MKYLLAATTLTVLAWAQPSLADGPREVVYVTDPQGVHRAIEAAAQKVCTIAVEVEQDQDFGTMADCVQDAIQSATVRQVSRAAVGNQIAEAR